MKKSYEHAPVTTASDVLKRGNFKSVQEAKRTGISPSVCLSRFQGVGTLGGLLLGFFSGGSHDVDYGNHQRRTPRPEKACNKSQGSEKASYKAHDLESVVRVHPLQSVKQQVSQGSSLAAVDGERHSRACRGLWQQAKTRRVVLTATPVCDGMGVRIPPRRFSRCEALDVRRYCS